MMNILVVDDDEKSRRLAADVLDHHGYVTQRAGSGEHALELAAATKADLVLLDIQLPGIDGVATFKALHALPGWSEVPVIAMTASVMPAERNSLLALGFSAFLAKPLSVKELVALVRETIAKANPTSDR